jgi:glycosyltransferase involved in cell wall biosynthesis
MVRNVEIEVDTMRILIICGGYPLVTEPNIYVFVHRQALALKKAGYDVVVLDIDLRSIRWKRKYGFYFEEYDGIDVYRCSFPFITVKFPRIYRFLSQRLSDICYCKIKKQIGNIDFLNAHFVKGAGEAGVYLKKKYDIPLVITEHSSAILNNIDNYVERYVKTYNEADAVVVVSNALKHRLLGYGINAYIIPNVIDTARFKLMAEKKKDKFIFLSVGRLTQGKRFDLTIKAFSKIHERYADTELLIIGKGEKKKEIVNMANQLAKKSVTFIKCVNNDDMPSIYNECDCFVLPSDFETFGMVYAEAISCGIPAIATDNGGSKEIINEHNGIIIPLNDVEKLTEAMKFVYENRGQFKRNELHQSIEERFGEKAFVNKYKEIISKVNDN